MNTESIEERYSGLAATSCCLSCGGALSLSGAKAGEVCVDLGSGRGLDVIRLAGIVGREGFVYGIDVTDGMIDKAQENAKKLDVDNVAFVKSDLEKIGLDSGIADLVISNCTINHAGDKRAVFSEIARILKPGGRFVISDIYSLEEVPEEYRNDPVCIAECWGGAIEKDVYLEIICKAGLTNVRILEESEPYLKGKIKIASFTVYGEKIFDNNRRD